MQANGKGKTMVTSKRKFPPVAHMTMQEHMLMAGTFEPITHHGFEILQTRYQRELRNRLAQRYPDLPKSE